MVETPVVYSQAMVIVIRFLEWLEEVSILLQFCIVGKDQED